MSSLRLCEEQWQHSRAWGGGWGERCPGCGFLWGEVVLSFETGGDSLAPPISLQAPGLCTLGLLWESGRPEDLWVAFGALLPFSGKMAHIYSQVALWSHLVESKQSFVHSLPLSLSPLVQTNDGIIPSLFPDLCWHGWLSLRVAPMFSLSCGCSVTPLVFSLEQTCFLLYR